LQNINVFLDGDGSGANRAFIRSTQALPPGAVETRNEEIIMSKLSRAFAVAFVVAMVPATIVVAQQADDGDQPAVEKTEKDRGPSPEFSARMEDGRIAMALGALKLTPEQQQLWAPVEEKIRANYAELREKRDEWRGKRKERREARKERTKRTLPERIEHRSERMAERATKMTERAAKAKQFAEVVSPFYESLTDEQKEVADHVLRRFAGGKGHHGHRGRHHGKRMCDRGGRGHGHHRWH
jgi:LTXXQ motif family protein